MNIFFITGNQGKFNEAQQIIPDLKQLELDLPEIQNIDPHEVIKCKLETAQKRHSQALIVEDTSLSFDCLGGLPGPLIKWFSKALGNDGLYQIAKKFNNFQATAKVVIGFSHNQQVKFFEGVIKGQIVSPQGELGFGWDPIFQPEGFSKTFAQMSTEEKNQISMRRIAFTKLKKYLKNQS